MISCCWSVDSVEVVVVEVMVVEVIAVEVVVDITEVIDKVAEVVEIGNGSSGLEVGPLEKPLE